MFNIFKKKNATDDPQKMGMLQRIAMKKLERMNPDEREKLLDAMEKMKSSGQISDEQIALAKKKLGL
jgi:hypothetical protein